MIMNRRLNSIIPTLLLLIAFLTLSCSKDDDTDSGLQVSTSDVEFVIDENPEMGQEIGMVPGSSNSGPVTFSIIEQSLEDAFSIEVNTGKLTVKKPDYFNHKINPILTGKIKVAQGTLFEISNVKIIVNSLGIEKWYEGDVRLTTQQAINEFGQAGYTHINGNLHIGSSEYNDIKDLTPLLTLEEITAYFRIENCTNLITTDGLQNIATIGQGLFIAYHRNLEKIIGFNHLKKLQSLVLDGNLSLTEIRGFTALSEIGDFQLFDNHLADLNAFNTLEKVTNFTLAYSQSLTNLDGLSNLKTIEEKVSITSNRVLENINGLSNVRSSVKRLGISENLSLENIDGISGISVSEWLFIEANPKLEHIDSLSNISNLYGVTIEDNIRLRNLDGLSNLVSIEEGIYIRKNQNLTNLDGLSQLQSLAGILSIQQNIALTDFCALQNCLTTNTPSSYDVSRNAYNPSLADIINGNCRL